MSNTCICLLKAVSKSKDALLRLDTILKGDDKEYYLTHIDDGFEMQPPRQDPATGLWECVYTGAMRNSGAPAFESLTDDEKKITVRSTGARLVAFDELCRKLDFGVEYWGEEEGCCFQEHYGMNRKGSLFANEIVDWTLDWTDDDGNELDEPTVTGGFGDRYEQFTTLRTIYGE